MTLNDQVTLIAVERITDVDGFTSTVETRSTVPVEVSTVVRSEFYEALKAGVSLTAAFLMWACDYDDQPFLEHDGVRYAIQRTHISKDKMEIELNCSEVIE